MIITGERGSLFITPLSLGAVLRRLREQQGLGLSRAARASGVSRGNLWKAERGDINITVGTLAKLAKAYVTAPSEIVFMAEVERYEVVRGRNEVLCQGEG